MSAIKGRVVEVPQENGPAVKLWMSGDEFYVRYENLEGYTVVYDGKLGLFTYSVLVNGELVSSGVPISNPAPEGLKKHEREDPSVRQRKFELKYARMLPPITRTMDERPRTIGEQHGLLRGRLLHEGKIKGLTILVEFPDEKINVSAANISEMLNKTGYNEGGNFCSVRDYYLKMSNGKLDYTNEVVGPITLKKNKMYYHFNLFVEEAMDAVVGMGIDLSRFDSKGVGLIDALSFLYAGNAVYDGELHPHNSYIDLKFGDIKTYLYMLSNLGTSKDDLAIGTICHETGHLLCRFPDLYDYGRRDEDLVESAGLGLYCLMSVGDHLDDWKTPSPVCAYFRNLAGWCDNVVDLNKPGKYEAKHGDYRTVMKYTTDRANEYFLVENRSQMGLDRALPSSGLAVYHCDILGSNEWQEGSPSKHFQCALLQRDGSLHLERGLNYGDGSDLYKKVNGVALSHDTNPSSKIWDRSDSGFIISDISEPGEVISFVVGPVISSDTVKGEANVSIAIPDNDVHGVSSSLNISEEGRASRIYLSLDISHSYISDLKVELISPSGKRAMIHNREGGGEGNLIKTYDSNSLPSLGDLVGSPINGEWSLTVADVAAIDKGVLNRWSIEIEKEASEMEVSKDMEPNELIPDNDPRGASVAMNLDKKGIVQRVVTMVDITHPFIGDLRVEILSPSGKTAIIHDRGGFDQDNLDKTYDSQINPELQAFVGQPAEGNWILRAMDLSRLDKGIINKWNMRVTYSG